MVQEIEDKHGKSVPTQRVKTGDIVVHGCTAMASVARNTPNTNEWILDSGVTHHISPNLRDFHQYHPLEEFLHVESSDSVSLVIAAISIYLPLESRIFLRVDAI